MTDRERARRIGRNEALYRQVNKRMEDLNETFAAVGDGDFTVVCECGRIECAEQVTVPREVYERTRSRSEQFIVRPGHDADDVERVVERHGGFSIVQKLPGTPRQVARQTDPRA